MPERKSLTAAFLSFLLIVRWILPLVQYGPVLQDPEFDAAIQWATEAGFPQMDELKKHPFTPVQRAESALRFAYFAQGKNIGSSTGSCEFTDIGTLPAATQEAIRKGCHLGFWKGFQGAFSPQDPLTKASAIVILVRVLAPDKQFPDVAEFRTPYLPEAQALGIIHEPKTPYLMYPISRYELLLMMYRSRGTKN